MAVTGPHDYTPENAFRVDLLNAVEAFDYHWSDFTLKDTDGTRTITLKATVNADHDYLKANQLRADVVAALDEHKYELDLFQLGDKEKNGDRVLTVRANRDLINEQMRVPGT